MKYDDEEMGREHLPKYSEREVKGLVERRAEALRAAHAAEVRVCGCGCVYRCGCVCIYGGGGLVGVFLWWSWSSISGLEKSQNAPGHLI